MKIYFGDTALNDGSQPLKSFEVSAKNSVSSLFAIGAENAITRQNLNTRTTVEFEIERAHASDAEAAEFAARHAAQLNAQAAQTAKFAGDDGGAPFLELGCAALNSVKTRAQNMSTTAKYSITGIIL